MQEYSRAEVRIENVEHKNKYSEAMPQIIMT